MKTLLTKAGWLAGFIYGLLAVVRVYSDAPLSLQVFIVIGVTGVGASVGYLVGFMAGSGPTEEERRPRAPFKHE